ncbi:hypothetical protein WG68_13480 [Arsukibacterium ikkense]|uniref:Uncharacterized protein n=1 Tax=Arsukibacterium ikkense TaxID=336831 RepID=A0A0M2V1W0_9GAMM|nr:DUF1240 domain-containing protein [Arsukibacterium ikkense]KKO44842.1 hypothetical protein WG68_13480 [Arsukibacterium ikkense]
MHPVLKVALVVLFEALAIAFALFFFWRIQQQHAAIAQSALVEIQSGTAFLLLPLILPLLHLMSVVEKQFATGAKQAKFRKLQSKLFIFLVLVLPGSGFVINQMVVSKLKHQGYQACDMVAFQTRSSFTTYSKDTALCPKP